MTQKIAVAIVHGIGRRVPHFADRMSAALSTTCRDVCGDDLVIRPVYWAPVLQDEEDALWERVHEGGALNYPDLRRLNVDFFADALAYQITPQDRRTYDAVHSVFAQTLRTLADEAGPTAPLCVIAHSLGTVIASNFIYDLQVDPMYPIIASAVRDNMENTPLEKGETLTLLYTLGSPIALWSLRYETFGKPITVPDYRIGKHYADLRGEWVNFYDKDDVVAFPLKSLNEAYNAMVTEDRQINVGNLITSWNPASHMGYWDDKDVLAPIAASLVRLWQTLNPMT